MTGLWRCLIQMASGRQDSRRFAGTEENKRKSRVKQKWKAILATALAGPLPKTSPCKTLDNLMRKTREKLNKRTEKQTEERINYFYAS